MACVEHIIILYGSPEKFVIFVRTVFFYKVFQRFQVCLMLLIYCNLSLRNTVSVLHCLFELRTVAHGAQLPQQLTVLVQLGGNANKFLIIHGKRNRIDLRICHITEKLCRLYLSSRQQIHHCLRTERRLLRYFLARLTAAKQLCFEFLGLLLYARLHLHNLKDRFRLDLCAPWKRTALLCQIFAKVPVYLIKIQHLRYPVFRNIKQKMSAIGDQPRTCHIYQPHIMRLAAVHQLQNQMMDRRIFFVILLICNPLTVKKLHAKLRILPVKRTFPAANKKMRIRFADLLRKKLIQQAYPLLLPVQSSSRCPISPSLRRRVCCLKQRCTPHRLSLEFLQGVIFVCNRISHRIRSDIQSQIVDVFSRHVDKPPHIVYNTSGY